MTSAVRVDRIGGLDLETARAGAGPPILFLHGLGGNHRSWDHQLLALSSRYLCVAWAMPGYGRSATSEPYGFPALASAAAGLVAHLGRGPATIVGHSMGGFVAQELALRHPEAVSSLLLAGTTAAFGRPGSDFNRRFLADRLAPSTVGAPRPTWPRRSSTGWWPRAPVGRFGGRRSTRCRPSRPPPTGGPSVRW